MRNPLTGRTATGECHMHMAMAMDVRNALAARLRFMFALFVSRYVADGCRQTRSPMMHDREVAVNTSSRGSRVRALSHTCEPPRRGRPGARAVVNVEIDPELACRRS